ncbi:MAG: hypothetical protein LKJ17_05355 [Oscillospiraceae bacterium]|nr:hypothetical protein [Oscillospiraceae bacterium]
MKKTAAFLAAALAACLFILSACSARTPVSNDDFKKQAEALGYTVAQGTDSLSASKSETDTQIIFTTCSDSISAQEQYASLKDSLTVTGGESTVDSNAYNKYTAQNGEIYYTLIRMDNTVLNCKGTIAKKDEMNRLIKALKY